MLKSVASLAASIRMGILSLWAIPWTHSCLSAPPLKSSPPVLKVGECAMLRLWALAALAILASRVDAGVTRHVDRPPPSLPLPLDHVAFRGERLSPEELATLTRDEECR